LTRPLNNNTYPRGEIQFSHWDNWFFPLFNFLSRRNFMAALFFQTKVDHRSRSAMVEFLKGHYRYDTMNSWNRSTAYANNIAGSRYF
jgi:hypothetical protein